MLLSVLLLICNALANHYLGTVITYYPKNTNTEGSITVVLRYKLNFHTCTQLDWWRCFTGYCGTEISVELNKVSEESSGEWCQREGIMTREIVGNAPFQLQLRDSDWIDDNLNGITVWRAVTLVDLRNRSDTGRANRSPRTTILPVVRVPPNCQRDLNLLAFDPDGDTVKCRFASETLSECDNCTLPSVFSLSPSCVLSFNSTDISAFGPYVIQLVMEDFPRQSITLTQHNGLQEVKTTDNAISKIPIQFVYRVDLPVSSCTEGRYLPKFQPPTPANGAQLQTNANQTLEISINVEAEMSTVGDLLFSGPYNMNLNMDGDGQYILRWTPSLNEDQQHHPVCFLAQGISNMVKYDSELRCVIVRVGSDLITTTMTPNTTTTESTNTTSGTSATTRDLARTAIGLTVKVSFRTPLTENDIRIVIQKLKDELVRCGIPTDSSLTVRK